MPPPNSNLRVMVFLVWRGQFAEMDYPDENDAFIYRADCGSYHQFRWSLRGKNNKDVVQLVVKHNSCIKSVSRKLPCENCKMRDKWHQSCTTPEDVFYALDIQPHDVCDDAISPHIRRTFSVNPQIAAAYLQSKPRPVLTKKFPKENERTRKKMLILKAKIRSNVLQQNQKAEASRYMQQQEVLRQQEVLMQQREREAVNTLEGLRGDMDADANTDSATLLTIGPVSLSINDLVQLMPPDARCN